MLTQVDVNLTQRPEKKMMMMIVGQCIVLELRDNCPQGQTHTKTHVPLSPQKKNKKKIYRTQLVLLLSSNTHTHTTDELYDIYALLYLSRVYF